MKYPNVFRLISDVTKKNGVACVLIGGFAVNYYKVTRQTADVDFLITREDFVKIEPALERAGYKPDLSQEVFIQLKNDSNAYLMDVDFMFVDKETLAKVIKDGKKTNIDRCEFLIPSLNTLIALKLHSLKYNLRFRENRDLPDIVDLIRVNKIDFTSKEFKDLCLKYGTQDIYNKILERVSS